MRIAYRGQIVNFLSHFFLFSSRNFLIPLDKSSVLVFNGRKGAEAALRRVRPKGGNMNKVITVSRQFGSGGREFGIKLAKALGIPFYDKDLISMAAENSNLSEEFMRHYEESAPGVFSRTLYSYYQMPMTDQIYIAQSNLIRQLADKGPCVLIGRCSDAIVESSIKIYVHAPLAFRVQRKLAMETGVASDKMEDHIKATDKKRKKYYEYYTDKKWGMAENHDLCMDSSIVGIDGCVETALAFIKNLQK